MRCCMELPLARSFRFKPAVRPKVPQPRDWLMLAQLIWTPLSFKAASKFHASAEFLQRTNGRSKDPGAAALAAMMNLG